MHGTRNYDQSLQLGIKNAIMIHRGQKANLSGQHIQLKGNSRITHEIPGFPERVTCNSFK